LRIRKCGCNPLVTPGVTQTKVLGKDRHRHRALLSKTLSVQFDAFNFVQRFGSQVTLPTVWTIDDGDILNDKQVCPFAVTACYVTNVSTFSTTNVTNHRFSLPTLPAPAASPCANLVYCTVVKVTHLSLPTSSKPPSPGAVDEEIGPEDAPETGAGSSVSATSAPVWSIGF